MLPLDDKKRYIITLILLLITISIILNNHFETNSLAPGIQVVKNSDDIAYQILSHLRTIPTISGSVKLNLWEKSLIVIFVFDIGDCGVCLARVDQIVTLIDSLSQKIDLGLICVGKCITPALLKRFIIASPKPCPVLLDTSKTSFSLFEPTPQIIIIDRRRNISLVKGIITANRVTDQFRNKLKSMILNGW